MLFQHVVQKFNRISFPKLRTSNRNCNSYCLKKIKKNRKIMMLRRYRQTWNCTESNCHMSFGTLQISICNGLKTRQLVIHISFYRNWRVEEQLTTYLFLFLQQTIVKRFYLIIVSFCFKYNRINWEPCFWI